jgi:2'-5' RNA ligase
MPRLFSAIALGPSARSRIEAEQHRLEAVLRGSLRWVRPEHLHLTLVFAGEVDEDRAANLVEANRRDLPQRPFRLELGGFGVFPSRGAPRALWLGVRSGVEEVVALQQVIAARCAAAGVQLDRRAFSPHLTLARWRDSRASEKPRDLDASRDIVATVEVSTVTLFQSHLSSKGPAYTVLATSTLTGPEGSLH